MPRTARLVYPDIAHHVIQRGNRRQDVFFTEKDYRAYLSLLKEKCGEAGTDILAYCLMNNHVHLILRPSCPEGLRVVGEVHRRYTRYINAQKGWQGYLWQGRFASYPMDERYLYEALRYVELNPVRAKICHKPEDYKWSSARQRIEHKDSRYDLRVAPLPSGMIEDWPQYWLEAINKEDILQIFEENEKALKPLGIFSAVGALGALGTQ